MAGSSDSSGNWLMTYADFITLMMIFFIVLYTFTPGVEQSKFEAIIGAFQGKQGVLRYDSVFSDEQLDIEIQRAKNWEMFEQYIQQENLSDEVQLDLMSDGIRITLGESVTFGTYSAELKQSAKEILKKIGKNLKSYTAEDLEEIEIQGHTDNRPVKPSATLYKSNWELGAARATSVLDFFVDNTHIEGEYLKASTYGPYRPRVENETEKGMQRNRRVEIYIRYKDPEDERNPEKVQKEPEKSKPIELNDGNRTSEN
jgi:chemotaxis protein MotB